MCCTGLGLCHCVFGSSGNANHVYIGIPHYYYVWRIFEGMQQRPAARRRRWPERRCLAAVVVRVLSSQVRNRKSDASSCESCPLMLLAGALREAPVSTWPAPPPREGEADLAGSVCDSNCCAGRVFLQVGTPGRYGPGAKMISTVHVNSQGPRPIASDNHESIQQWKPEANPSKNGWDIKGQSW